MTTSELKSKLQKSLDYLEGELTQVRTGRASPAMIEDLPVKVYESMMTLKELGAITVLDSQNLSVAPWDRSLLKEIAKAIRESDLNVNPVVETAFVRVPVPALTEERRKEFAKLVSSKVEETKTSMRNIRQEAMKDIEKAFSEKEIGEDDKFTQKEEVEDIVKDFVTQAEEIGAKKREDVMSV